MPVLPPHNNSEVIIFGCGSIGEMYFTHLVHDSSCYISSFIEDRPTRTHFLGRPVCALSDIDAPRICYYAAIGYTGLNSVRQRVYATMRDKGFTPITYVHSTAVTSPEATLGEHVYVMENSVIQYNVRIGNNTIIHMGCNIAHHSIVGENCFIAQGVNICGIASIGSNCFIGTGAIIYNEVTIGNNCVIAAGSVVKNSLPDDSMISSSGAVILNGAKERFERWLNKNR